MPLGCAVLDLARERGQARAQLQSLKICERLDAKPVSLSQPERLIGRHDNDY
jgi:hypothetical protein